MEKSICEVVYVNFENTCYLAERDYGQGHSLSGIRMYINIHEKQSNFCILMTLQSLTRKQLHKKEIIEWMLYSIEKHVWV